MKEVQPDADQQDDLYIQKMIDNNLSLKTELQMVFDQMDQQLIRLHKK